MKRIRTELVVKHTTVAVHKIFESYYETKRWGGHRGQWPSTPAEQEPAIDAEILPRRPKLPKGR